MRRFTELLAGILFSLVLSFPLNEVAAQSSASAEAQAIHAVIQTQLEAFQEDDAAAAFDLATASTRDLLGTPENFLRMVRELFPPIYRHRHVIFDPPEIVGKQAMQIVTVTDNDNVVWVVIYLLQQEGDGNWKVDGYNLFETDSVAV